jgi:hypothetical protein
MISAHSNIVCFDDIADSTQNIINQSVDSQLIDFKRLSGISTSTPKFGLCSASEYTEYRINQARKDVTEFIIISKSASLMTIFEDDSTSYFIEAYRIKYSFMYDNREFIVMELISFCQNVGFFLEFGASKQKYVEYESEFVNLTNNAFLKTIK